MKNQTTTTEYKMAINGITKGKIQWCPNWTWHFIKKSNKLLIDRKKIFLTEQKLDGHTGYVGGMIDPRGQHFVFLAKKPAEIENVGFDVDTLYHGDVMARLLQQIKAEQDSGYVILMPHGAFGKVLCRVENDHRSGRELMHRDQMMQATDAFPEIMTKDAAQALIDYHKKIKVKARYATGTPVKFRYLCESWDMDACELCGSVNTEHDGASGDGGKYVGYQECTWTVCKCCGHQSDAE